MERLDLTYDYVWRYADQDKHYINLRDTAMEVYGSIPQGQTISNRGGYHSINLKEDARLEFLIRMIEEKAKIVGDEIELVDQIELKIMNIWFNINFTNTFNVFHKHVDAPAYDRLINPCLLTGAYYVNVPDNSGNILLHQSREEPNKDKTEPSILHIPEIFLKNIQNPMLNPVRSISPKDGDLLIWMADIMHAVEPNNSEDLRISISFNLGAFLK